MLSPSEFRELVSGRRQGVTAALLRGLLSAIELPYTAAVRWRNARYDRDPSLAQRVGVPVVSVGNLTLGGTGKTPTVEWLARWFLEHQVRIALVSRGYGARDGAVNDEALELAEKLPNVPHVQDPDRVRGARQAIADFRAQAILLDDGFQHRRLARDLNIVLIDALEPFGFGHVFPRGTLREPLSGWQRADVLILTRARVVDDTERASIRGDVLRHAPHAAWVEADYVPQALVNGPRQQPLARLAGQRVAAFCGIGNPASFRAALAGLGYAVTATREFADHFAFGPREIDELAAWADALGVAGVICTCKDLVKIGDRWPGKTPLWALSSQLEILTGRGALERQLSAIAHRSLGTRPATDGDR